MGQQGINTSQQQNAQAQAGWQQGQQADQFQQANQQAWQQHQLSQQGQGTQPITGTPRPPFSPRPGGGVGGGPSPGGGGGIQSGTPFEPGGPGGGFGGGFGGGGVGGGPSPGGGGGIQSGTPFEPGGPGGGFGGGFGGGGVGGGPTAGTGTTTFDPSTPWPSDGTAGVPKPGPGIDADEGVGGLEGGGMMFPPDDDTRPSPLAQGATPASATPGSPDFVGPPNKPTTAQANTQGTSMLTRPAQRPGGVLGNAYVFGGSGGQGPNISLGGGGSNYYPRPGGTRPTRPSQSSSAWGIIAAQQAATRPTAASIQNFFGQLQPGSSGYGGGYSTTGGTPFVPPTAQHGAGRRPIPRFRGGGIVTQPTVAMIGERGPEAVVPLQSSASQYAGFDPQKAQPGMPYGSGLANRAGQTYAEGGWRPGGAGDASRFQSPNNGGMGAGAPAAAMGNIPLGPPSPQSPRLQWELATGQLNRREDWQSPDTPAAIAHNQAIQDRQDAQMNAWLAQHPEVPTFAQYNQQMGYVGNTGPATPPQPAPTIASSQAQVDAQMAAQTALAQTVPGTTDYILAHGQGFGMGDQPGTGGPAHSPASQLGRQQAFGFNIPARAGARRLSNAYRRR